MEDTGHHTHQAPNDIAYKRCSCHSGHKLLCKLCRTFPPPAMGARFTVFGGKPAMRTRWIRRYPPSTIHRYLDLLSTQRIQTHNSHMHNTTRPLQTLVQAPYPLPTYATHTTATETQTHVQHVLLLLLVVCVLLSHYVCHMCVL